MKANKLSGVYDGDMTVGSTFLSQNILQTAQDVSKPGNTSSLVPKGSYNQLRAQHNEIQKHNSILHQRLEVIENENTKLRKALKDIQSGLTRKQWDKQRQQLITCVKRIEMLVKERDTLQKKQKTQDSYIYKLENTILK